MDKMMFSAYSEMFQARIGEELESLGFSVQACMADKLTVEDLQEKMEKAAKALYAILILGYK